jgi:dihydrofolate synthase/folylpolyglutamate synthase
MSALDRLFAREQFGVKLGLDNIRTLVDALGHPQTMYPSVLVAGTNGKGSVAAMVERALRASGRRTGRYTSPHLVHVVERFAIDGEPVGDDMLETVVADVLAREEACRAAGRLAAPATFFETTTAAAFEIFRRARVDVAVLEVGLGGRFDATNVASPVVTAIVSIDIDHTRQLGSTLGAIAFEKAGIARKGVPLVVGDIGGEAMATIEQVCADVGAPVVHAAEGVECLVADGSEGRSELRAETATRMYGPLLLGLPGQHQIGNAVVAIRVLEELDSQGISVDGSAIETGLREVRWRGRLERIALSNGRWLLLDAAHNPAGARALAAHVARYWPDGPALVFAAAADKDAEGMLGALAPTVGDIVLTQFADLRAARASDLAAAAPVRSGRRISVIDDPRVALDAALASSSRVVVAGSIFLLGELLPYVDSLRGPDQTDRGD